MDNPTTAAWAEKCNQDYLTSMRVEGRSNGHLRHGLCLHCADAYARQRVREALEEAGQVAFRYQCDCPETMLCGHRVAAGRIAAAIAALREGRDAT